MGFYIYLGCLYGSCRSCHKQGEQGEHLATHGLSYDLINTRIKYLWYSLRSDHNNCRIVASQRKYTVAWNPKGVFPFLQLGLRVERLHGIRMRKACILSLVLAFWYFAPLRQTVRSSRRFFIHLMHGKCLHVPYIETRLDVKRELMNFFIKIYYLL